jgi:ribosomal protein S10
MASITAIKVTGMNHVDVDSLCNGIKQISEQTGVAMRGPIPDTVTIEITLRNIN